MPVAETSLQTFREIVDSLPARRDKVYRILATGEASINQVAAFLNCFPNQISGRFTELRNLGLIEEAGRRKSPNGKPEKVWRAVTQPQTPAPGEQAHMF